MKFFSGFGKGVAMFFKAFGFVFEKGLWHYIFYPLVLWIIMFLIGLYFTSELGDYIQVWVDKQVNTIPDEGHWLSWFKSFVNGYLGFIAAWLIKLTLWAISGTFMKYLTLILLSPVFSLLSESVAEKMGAKAASFNFGQLLKDVLRGILINLRNMMLEYLLIFGCFILGIMFLPLSFILYPFLLLAGWYFIGFSMMDYSCERNKMGVIKSIRFIRSNMGIACGIGFCYSILMWLPMVGMMFAPVMAVAGATMAVEEIKKKETNVSKTV